MNPIYLSVLSAAVFFSTSAEARPPVDYFEFASNTQVSPARVRALAEKYKRSVMIGGDSGHQDFGSTMAAAKAAGVLRHVYLEGPGGPTGSSGIEAGELARMKSGARYAKINTNDRDWMSKWNSYGWKVWTRHQIKDIYAGFDSYEIDNLDRGTGQGVAALISFLKEQQAWAQQNGVKATMLLKNVTGSQWPALAAAIKSGAVSRDGLTEFAISEEDTPGKDAQKKYAASVGIQVLDSTNTYAYAAHGEYRVGHK